MSTNTVSSIGWDFGNSVYQTCPNISEKNIYVCGEGTGADLKDYFFKLNVATETKTIINNNVGALEAFGIGLDKGTSCLFSHSSYRFGSTPPIDYYFIIYEISYLTGTKTDYRKISVATLNHWTNAYPGIFYYLYKSKIYITTNYYTLIVLDPKNGSYNSFQIYDGDLSSKINNFYEKYTAYLTEFEGYLYIGQSGKSLKTRVIPPQDKEYLLPLLPNCKANLNTLVTNNGNDIPANTNFTTSKYIKTKSNYVSGTLEIVKNYSM